MHQISISKTQSHLPFIGNSGKLLDKLLMSIKLNRSEVFTANNFKHRPPEPRNPISDESRVCAPYPKAQLKISKSKQELPLIIIPV